MPELTGPDFQSTARPPISRDDYICHLPPRAAMGAFLEACGWAGTAIVPLAGDASFRRYYRLQDDGRRAVLMDAPPPQEDIVPYVAVSTLLRSLGLSAPEIFSEDREAGF